MKRIIIVQKPGLRGSSSGRKDAPRGAPGRWSSRSPGAAHSRRRRPVRPWPLGLLRRQVTARRSRWRPAATHRDSRGVRALGQQGFACRAHARLVFVLVGRAATSQRAAAADEGAADEDDEHAAAHHLQVGVAHEPSLVVADQSGEHRGCRERAVPCDARRGGGVCEKEGT